MRCILQASIFTFLTFILTQRSIQFCLELICKAEYPGFKPEAPQGQCIFQVNVPKHQTHVKIKDSGCVNRPCTEKYIGRYGCKFYLVIMLACIKTAGLINMYQF